MMKSFFKKLAFVMALAMVVSMAAPAGSALAAGLSVAYQNGGAVSELNVKAGAEQDLKFLGAPKNWKDLGFAWTSSNEAVATVDQAGLVTAVADGTATITITVGDLTGSVVVNVGEAKAYDVTLGNADNKAMTAAELKEGASLDLNFYGVKDWNKDNYTVAWSVSGDAANVDKNGVVTAVKAGKAVVTASIVNNLTGVAHKVAPVEVTVAGSVNPDSFTVAQKDTDKFVLTFAEAKTADAIKENLTVSVKIGEQDFPISFENVTVDGTTATVTTYANFENEEVYTLTFGKEVVAHTIVLGDVAAAGVNYYTGKNKDNKVAYVTEEEENDYVTLVPVLFDQYGNDITAKYDLNNFTFTYSVSSNVAPVCVYNDTFAFDAAGLATVDVSAAWVTDAGEFKEVTGQGSILVQKRGSVNIKLVKSGIADVSWLNADDVFTYFTDPKESFQMDPNSTVWNHASTSIMYLTEDARDLVYTAVLEDNRGNVITTNDIPMVSNTITNGVYGSYKFGSFIYESTNSEVLTVADGTGEVDINGVGKANILVYYLPADGTETKRLVASTPVVVTPETYPASYKMTVAMNTTASEVLFLADYKGDNANDSLNDVTYKVQFYDQFGKVYRNDDLIPLIKVEARDIKNTFGVASTPSWEDWSSSYVFTLDGSDFAADLGTNNSKTYSYKLYVEEADLTEKIKTPYAVFSIAVKNTSEECAILDNYLTGDRTVPANYKFNIGVGGNQNVDIAVKNIQNYGNTQAQAQIKHTYWSTQVDVRYLSTGNLPLCLVPTDHLINVNQGTTKLTTGYVGYVYYKVNAPSRTMFEGKSTANDAWEQGLRDGVIDFAFNALFANGTMVEPGQSWEWLHNVIDKDDNGNYKYITGNENFKYAANGNYTVSLYTTRKNDTAINNIATRTIAISNSQNQVKYLGLNPEFNGVTELTTSIDASDLDAIVEEQLRFSFDELFLGDYYGYFDGWDSNNVTIAIDHNAEGTKVHYATDGKSVNITSLAIKVTLDDGNANTSFTYTSVVSVGARIKVK